MPRVGRTFLHVQLSWRLDLVFLHTAWLSLIFRLLQPMVHTTTLASEHRPMLPNRLDRYSPDTPRKSLAFLRSSA
eukprot:COSAG01_NODE_5231_length_4396_cov_4.301373_3_plen_75_part_00